MLASMYYLWYDKQGGRWKDNPPHSTPQLGLYWSGDGRVMGQHCQWMKKAGVDVVVVSWWGTQDNALYNVFAIIAKIYGLKVAPHIEIDVDGNKEYADAVQSISKFNRLEIGGKPVAFAYRTWAEHVDPRIPGVHVVSQNTLGDSRYVYNSELLVDMRLAQCISVSAGFWHSHEKEPRRKRVLEDFEMACKWLGAAESAGWLWQVIYFNEWVEGTQLEPDKSGLIWLEAVRKGMEQ